MNELYDQIDFDPAKMECYLERGRIERARATANALDAVEGLFARAANGLRGYIRNVTHRDSGLGGKQAC